MKNTNFTPKVILSFICIIIITLIFFRLTLTFNSQVNAKTDDTNEDFDIFNGLDLSSNNYYGTYLNLDEDNIRIREFSDHKYKKEPTSFDLSKANIFTSKEVVEYNSRTGSDSVYIIYEKVKLKNIDKLLNDKTNIKFWITDDNICENMIIELN